MKGYIYTMFSGADPGLGWQMTDPIFGKVPTLGSCVPNIRRAVVPGDYIFVVSGRVRDVQQYVVGGFKVTEKINALTAFKRLPDNRLHKSADGTTAGNIIVDSRGRRHPLDAHDNFERRIENYVIGTSALTLSRPQEVKRGRDETLETLVDIFDVARATSVGQVIGRWRRMDDDQIERLVRWMRAIKAREN